MGGYLSGPAVVVGGYLSGAGAADAVVVEVEILDDPDALRQGSAPSIRYIAGGRRSHRISSKNQQQESAAAGTRTKSAPAIQTPNFTLNPNP